MPRDLQSVPALNLLRKGTQLDVKVLKIEINYLKEEIRVTYQYEAPDLEGNRAVERAVRYPIDRNSMSGILNKINAAIDNLTRKRFED